ncbi:hypothetical protein DFH09DRAFT_290185 [Mycena vulgaris]|nr:hypothetical protein DFH09DRAFT_290185 [Mycena vulgaris]
MAISLHPVKGPFVDSSNRTKNHSHLRPSTSSSLRKSPPTRTVSLASVTASPYTVPAPFPASFVPFPNVDLPAESESGECGAEPVPEPWRRPRARTSHVETPRRAQPKAPTPSGSKPLRPKHTSGKRAANAAALADLRFTALVERSITHRLQERERSVDDPFLFVAASDLDAQDELLTSRLCASLARQGWRRPASPTRWTLPARPPSVLLSGDTGLSLPSDAQTSVPLRLVMTPSTRARSGSRGSSSSATLPMPALVAALLLRRHNERLTSHPDTGVRTLHPRSMRMTSPLAQPANAQDVEIC